MGEKIVEQKQGSQQSLNSEDNQSAGILEKKKQISILKILIN
ncbi:MAG: hypothetical protein N4A49_02415 [Marinifilaceae bacterium]|jgi:hypothetical protein|nr:hypothetical protein [Marinifilaceae bacterium]